MNSLGPKALALLSAAFLAGCGATATTTTSATPALPLISSVTPSSSGVPNSVATFGNYEFVSVQGAGQIFTYNIASGTQLLAGQPYKTPCNDPSGMVVTPIGGANIMAVVCYDTDSLLTLTVHADGSLTALGSVAGLPLPFPGIALDGTDVFVPLYGQSQIANGGVAKVSIALPTAPVVTGVASLSSPASGGFANPGFLTLSGGYIFVTAGSESGPQTTSSSIQVVSEGTMKVVGQPLVVAHSPQQIAISGTIAYVSLYDAGELVSVDVSDPTKLKTLQTASLATVGCHPIPVAVRELFVYVGCYAEGQVERFDVEDLTNPSTTESVAAIAYPQRLLFSEHYLLVPSSTSGGVVYEIDTGAF